MVRRERLGRDFAERFEYGYLAHATQAIECKIVFGSFSNVYCDASKDELIVTMAYRGTNPHHTFFIEMGRCKDTQVGVLRVWHVAPPATGVRQT
jgi:hypothetical protein